MSIGFDYTHSSWERKLQTNLKLFLAGSFFFFFCSGIYKQFWTDFRYIIGLSKLVNEMMSLRARILTVEESTCIYGIEEGKKELCENDYNWRYWCKLMISKMCVHTCLYKYTCMCICVRVCMWIICIYFLALCAERA